MNLLVENSPEEKVSNFSSVKNKLKVLRSYGPHSYASLTDAEGSYVQVAGGLFTCFVERFDFKSKKIYRAIHDNSSTNFKDGSLLVFGGGSVALNANEWFKIDDVIEIFECFWLKKEFPDNVDWLDITMVVNPD